VSRKINSTVAVLVGLRDDQTCEACKKPLARHEITNLGAIRCLDRPNNAGLTRWIEHGFKTFDDEPYLSLMEQVGSIAATLEEMGLPKAHKPVLTMLDQFRKRLAALAQEAKPS
jgi:hypothetical protein